jgi:ubiquinone/menaquinone biosynthesis C-methylase UbiE
MLSTAEKQMITTLSWFRSRYALFLGLSPDRKADKINLDQFGQVWIGEFKEDWTDIYEVLIQKNILHLEYDTYSFTNYGEKIKDEVEAEIPFFKYEYDNYFNLEKTSLAHARFCEEVYGLDLSQHGLIDQDELRLLIELLKAGSAKKILDLGCGNGKITEWIAQETGILCVGLDISSEGIQLAKQRTTENNLVHFETGNLNLVEYPDTFDVLLFLDTLYYANNLKDTILSGMDILQMGGRIYAYFSQWIMEAAYSENLQPDKTHLGKVLQELNLDYFTIDLSSSGIHHWKKKWDTLNAMKDDFIQEGNEALWEYRYREAYRYAHWGDEKYARFLYVIRK